VRSVLTLVVSASPFVDPNLPEPNRVTDDTIRAVFERWRSQSKAKTAVDLNISRK
jgi:hypothetical protein